MRDDDHRNREPRERRSWRDIDAGRGRRGNGETVRRDDSGPSAAASKSYRAQLEKLFARGEAAKLLGDRAVRSMPGRSEPPRSEAGAPGDADHRPSAPAAGARA